MNITAKQINQSNVACTFKEEVVNLPEPANFFAAYSSEDARGSFFSDNSSAATRIFELPAKGIQWIFEPNRIRLEERKHRTPDESKLTIEFLRVMNKLYPNVSPNAYGFNFDIIYRMDNVIPTGEIMGQFVKSEIVESVKDFGWQYTLSRDKGRRQETYFLKVVSPLEYAVHANFHFNQAGLPKEKDMENGFERSYAEADAAIVHIAF